VTLIRAILLTSLFAIATLPLSATTWYVRADGGTRYTAKSPSGQCDGRADARYPGKGANQHCAFKDVRYLWNDGSVGNWGWVIAGGDTVVIHGCAAGPGQANPSNPDCRIGWDNGTANGPSNPWCWYAPGNYGSPYNCYNPPIPAGTASAHTKILGACALTETCSSGNTTILGNLTQIFGGFADQVVLNLSDTQYVDIEGLEITEHNGKCVQYGFPGYPRGCNNSFPGADDFAHNGILTNKATRNIQLQDVYVHGFTASGIWGPIGGLVTMTRVQVSFNGFAGWNFDDGQRTPNAANSSIIARYVTMEGNGCDEQYPIVNTQFPAMVCYDDNSGGFGDSWSGQDTPIDTFICDHCAQFYNTKDGFIGPHVSIVHLTITNSESYGNMGQQWKWGAAPGSTTIFQNNVTVGNCRRMAEPLPGASSGYNRFLTDFCRAAGDVFSFNTGSNSTLLFSNNSTVAYSATIFDLDCRPKKTCASSHFVFRNNIVLGFQNPKYNDELPGLFYLNDSSVKIEQDHSVFSNLRSKPCLLFGSSDSICDSPAFVGQPPAKLGSEAQLDHFNFHITSRSPAIGHAVAIQGITSDYYGNTRPAAPSIGAAEPTR
jgi:hypothetical protein